MRWALVALLLAGCGDDGGGVAPDAGDGCTMPALDAPWLASYVGGIVADIPAPRATVTERNAARTYLQAQLAQLGLSPQLHSYASGANVVATIPATTGATRTLVVGAHFDTVTNSPGANDNATGVAAVLAVGRFVSAMTCRDHAVTLALFDEEEVGLVGARAYAATLEPANVVAVHTVDQIGWDMDDDQRFELEMPTAALEAEYVSAAAVVGVPVTRTTTEGTDHQAFRDRGFDAVGLTEEYVANDTSPHRHTTQDTAATVETSYLALGTQLVARVVMTALTPAP